MGLLRTLTRVLRGVGPVEYRRFIVAAALAAAALPAQAAPVEPDRQATGEALILVPLTLTKIDDLDFGTVINSPVSGTVKIDPITGARSVTGGITAVPSDAGKRAYFGGGGSPLQPVVITVTAPAQLASPAGDTLNVMALMLDGPPIRIIDPTTRTFFFGIGGIIEVGANQPEGVYSAEFNVTANYF